MNAVNFIELFNIYNTYNSVYFQYLQMFIVHRYLFSIFTNVYRTQVSYRFLVLEVSALILARRRYILPPNKGVLRKNGK